MAGNTHHYGGCFIDDFITYYLMILFPKNPSIHHPRAGSLGLTNEKIILLSANSIRATVATENNKV